jgi:predicted metal-dependent hydrolase
MQVKQNMNINLEGRIISYQLIKKKRKTISIKITESGEVLVSAPLYLSDAKIEELIKGKAKWIVSKLEILSSSKDEDIDNIESLKFLGKNYKLNINDSKDGCIKVSFDSKEFYVNVPNKIKEHRDKYIKEALANWYKTQAVNIYKERTELYCKILDVKPNRITIKEQKTRWGSCSSRGNLNFNWRVIMAPIEVIDYLVVHELCHLVHMNHSKDFWNLVKSVLPTYETYKEWLKLNGNKLKI